MSDIETTTTPKPAKAQKAEVKKAVGVKEKIDDWSVVDTLARVTPRIHEMADHTEYALKAKEPTPMPEHHARIFLSDPAFIVRNEKGDHIAALPKDAGTTPGQQIPRLQAGQTIASFEELTTDALINRAIRRPAGNQFTRKSAREDVLAFLMENDQSVVTSLAKRRDGSKGMSPDEELGEDAAADMLARFGN